ncbi:hypothetical protein MPTK1_6g06760 [Marchantia polymorpha subsp. ruderalis]|uniref:Uncharacterized protein n=2 Tax=Marchantia polymorpha TaxID=3197 RepID=A0AAF6BP95_MARPO|nr:hypothetical protein MARPO_0173s0021 [Marchantia polymorpha]BBN13829.1 hypothetical protein Mp_6g06760 [Marchantia polymorpha subsp. ruderalis]|eukprot:PTQ28118.1 hypothetical protein MARPO_0173s0021 [Marchantia polymorpha]
MAVLDDPSSVVPLEEIFLLGTRSPEPHPPLPLQSAGPGAKAMSSAQRRAKALAGLWPARVEALHSPLALVDVEEGARGIERTRGGSGRGR